MWKIFQILALVLPVYLIWSIYFPKTNNTCKSFIDYYFSEGNDNCYYDPDAVLETPELIKKYAGSIETHEVITQDGYILTMFRIPRHNSKKVILLHHSIAVYSRLYLFEGNQSLAITLWRNGFDVWLANHRGTSYSDRHVNMTKFDFRYWDFYCHELGFYDISSELKLISQKTNGSKVIYFGHSLGATAGLVYASLKSEEASQYLKDMILLSPGTQFKHINIGLHFLKHFFRTLQIFTDYFQIGSPLVNRDLTVPRLRILTRAFPPIQILTTSFVWIFSGFTPLKTNPLFFSSDFATYLNDFSWKTFYHLAQNVTYFKMYDYGSDTNVKIYGDSVPPLYPLEKITVPTLMISSSSDTLTPQGDCDDVFKRFSAEAATHGHWKYTDLNHLDFLTGVGWRESFGQKLLDFLNKVST